MPDRDQAIAAIKAANPKWSDRHVSYAYTLMPTSASYCFAEGTRERAQADAWFLFRWTKWAIEMNILPDDTPMPPEVAWPDGAISRRRLAIVGGTDSRAPAAPPGAPGRKMPTPGTIAARIWYIADEETKRLGRQATVDEVLAVARTQNLNEGNTRTEFSNWRKYHSTG